MLTIIAEHVATGRTITLRERVASRTPRQRAAARLLVTILRSEIERDGWCVYAR